MKLQKTTCNPCGINSLHDKAPSELNSNFSFISELLGLIIHESQYTGATTEVPVARRLLATLPTAFDWRSYNVLTPIKDQGDCGSCWAFSAVAFLESESIRRGGSSNVDLSEQYLLKCQTTHSLGCNGGDIFYATAFGLTGMPFESRYTYKASTNQTTTSCTRPTIDLTFLYSGVVVRYYNTTVKASDDLIIQYLLIRPLLIGVNALDMLNYAPTPNNNVLVCAPENSDGKVINHGMLLVGYTSTYWILRNHWSSYYGVNGYVYVTRDPAHSCNIGYYWGSVNSTLPTLV